MKKFVLVALPAIICLIVSFSFAQSRRVTAPDNNQKTNKRPATPAATPSPQTENSEQDTNAPLPTDDEIITVETEVVTIPVKVSDRSGKFIPGLAKENFTVFEDGTEQEIAFFSNEQQPFTVALVLDMSYSTTFKINEIQSAAIAFIDQLRKNDKIMVVSFDEEVHILTEPTDDRGQIYRAIKSTKIASGTSLYEAVDIVINQKLKRIKGRKAIVLFTDGVDTTSRRVHDLTNLRDALEFDALVYPIKYDTYADVQAIKNKTVIVPPTIPSPLPPKNPSPFPIPIPTGGVGTPSSQGTTAEDYRKAGEYLDEMANRTGGRIYEASTTGSLASAFSKIASELREFYSLGYYPKDDAKTGKRQIKVKVDRKGLSVRARDGYAVGRKKTK
jgi:VWFA-related protein